LAADTTVVSPKNKNLGKPINLTEARSMLMQLQGRTHSVFTAYTIMKVNLGIVQKIKTRVVQTRVTFRKLKKFEIDAYLSRGESMDKAGAYAAQGAGMSLVEKMNGSYTNVVGLPLSEVIQDFHVLGLSPHGQS
jgi:septum formation protein